MSGFYIGFAIFVIALYTTMAVVSMFVDYETGIYRLLSFIITICPVVLGMLYLCK